MAKHPHPISFNAPAPPNSLSPPTCRSVFSRQASTEDSHVPVQHTSPPPICSYPCCFIDPPSQQPYPTARVTANWIPATNPAAHPRLAFDDGPHGGRHCRLQEARRGSGPDVPVADEAGDGHGGGQPRGMPGGGPRHVDQITTESRGEDLRGTDGSRPVSIPRTRRGSAPLSMYGTVVLT